MASTGSLCSRWASILRLLPSLIRRLTPQLAQRLLQNPLGFLSYSSCAAGKPDGYGNHLLCQWASCTSLSISAALTGVTTQTVSASVGTAGAGVPTLTSAIANLNQLDDYYKVWSIFYTTTTELSATAVQVEAQAAPAILKQTVVILRLLHLLPVLLILMSLMLPRRSSALRHGICLFGASLILMLAGRMLPELLPLWPVRLM